MEYLIIFLLLLTSTLILADDLTIYQTNGQKFALVHSSQPVKLIKGENTIELINLAKYVKFNSLLLLKDNPNIQVISQDFQADYGSVANILEYALEKQVKVIIADSEPIKGILRLYDGLYLGISDQATAQFHLIKEQEIVDIQLTGIPNDPKVFNPSISWKLFSTKTQDIDLKFSYITENISWKAIYQAVWDDVKNELYFDSQVELTNNCGKEFLNSKIKLLAGDVQNIEPINNQRFYNDMISENEQSKGGMAVSQAPISAFHLYTLAQSVDLASNSRKQFQLYPSATIKADEYFFFNSNGYQTKLQKTIAFINSTDNGMGKPLPQGIVKMYTQDKQDGQNQFIGDSNLENTPVGKKVVIVLGDAFDLNAETKTINIRYTEDNRRVISSDYQITIENHSSEDAPVLVRHKLDNQLPEIYAAEFEYEKIDVNTMEIHLIVPADSKSILSWSQKR